MSDPKPELIRFERRLSEDDIRQHRGETTPCVIRPMTRTSYAVRLTDSEDSHVVNIVQDGEAFSAACTCDGFRYHDGPCSHQWAVYYADKRQAIDIEPIDDVLAEPGICPMCGADHHDEAA